MRYYPEFCLEYGFMESGTNGLMPFIDKFQEEKHAGQQRRRAVDALLLYYRNNSVNNGKNMGYLKLKIG